MDFNQKGSGRAIVILLFVVLYYISKRGSVCLLHMVLLLYGISRLLIITACRRKWASVVCECPARRSLSGTHSRQNVRAAATEADKRTAAASMPASRHRSLAGVIMLLDVGTAATEEQGQME